MISVLLSCLALGAPADSPVPTPKDPVRIDVHGTGLYHLNEGQLGGGIGGGIGGGTKPVLFEIRTDAQYVASKPRLLLWPALRLHVLDADRPKAWRPSLVVGAGLEIADPLGPALIAGLDLDLPGNLKRNPRVGLRATTDVNGNWVAGVNLGLAMRLIRDSPAPPPPDPVEPPPVPVAEGPWWDPETCTWVDEDPGFGWSPADGIGLVSNDGDPDSNGSAAGGGPNGSGAPPPGQGWLMVVGAPGDVVRLARQDGSPVPPMTVGSDGVAKMAAAEGVAEVTIAGGGREQSFEAAISDGYVLWLRAALPEEVSVQFASGSSTVSAADRAAAEDLAENRGQYQLQVSGSYSPEGSLQGNLALARRRAAAISRVLQNAGVPAEDIVILDPTPPREGLTAAEQRAVYIMPAPRGER